MALLGVLGCIYATAVLAQGGEIPEVWLRCQCTLGLLALGWAIVERRAPFRGSRAASHLDMELLLLPLYAAFQVIPLPPAAVKLLSPTRAELHHSVAVLLPGAPDWAPLSVQPAASLAFALRLASYALVYWLVRSAASRLPRNPFGAAMPFLLVAGMEASLALLQAVAGKDARGSYVNRNHLAGLLEMSLPFAAAAIRAPNHQAERHGSQRSLVWTLLAAAATLLMLAAVVATRSRAGFVAALGSLAVVWLAARRRNTSPRARRGRTVLLLAALALAFLYLPSENLVRRYGYLASGDHLLREGRLRLWRETLDLAAAYPLFGCGFGGYESAFLRYKRSAPMLADAHAHNDYLELLAEGGVFGLALCVALLAPLFARIVRAVRDPQDRPGNALAAACLGSLTAILLHSAIDFNLHLPANGMLLFWVLGLGAIVVPRRSGSPRFGRCESWRKRLHA